MQSLLPENNKFNKSIRITHTTAAPGSKILAGIDQLLLILPKKVPSQLWRKVQQGNKIKNLMRRRSKGTVPAAETRLNNKRQTRVLVGTVSPDTDAFKELTLGRKLIDKVIQEAQRTGRQYLLLIIRLCGYGQFFVHAVIQIHLRSRSLCFNAISIKGIPSKPDTEFHPAKQVPCRSGFIVTPKSCINTNIAHIAFVKQVIHTNKRLKLPTTHAFAIPNTQVGNQVRVGFNLVGVVSEEFANIEKIPTRIETIFVLPGQIKVELVFRHTGNS